MSVWEIIGQLFEWLRDLLVPGIIVIKATEGGVKYKWGKEVIELKPGVHIYWRLVSDIEYRPITTQAIILKGQDLTTKDGVTVFISGTITYHIDDVVAAITEAFEIDETIGEMARRAIPAIITQTNFDDLRMQMRRTKGSTKLDRKLTKAARELLSPFGVGVDSLVITDFTKSQVIRGLGSSDYLAVSAGHLANH